MGPFASGGDVEVDDGKITVWHGDVDAATIQSTLPSPTA